MYILYQNIFDINSKSLKRRIEFTHCLRKNLIAFDKIVLFSDGPDIIKSEKIEIIYKEKTTFNDFFSYTKDTQDSDLNVISNLDIYLNRDVLDKINGSIKEEVFALSRWNLINYDEKKAKLFDLAYSQDCWIKKGPFDIHDASFGLGLGGCDNRIAHILSKKYKVRNPSKTIKTYHVHEEESREWHQKRRVPGPYKNLEIEEL